MSVIAGRLWYVLTVVLSCIVFVRSSESGDSIAQALANLRYEAMPLSR